MPTVDSHRSVALVACLLAPAACARETPAPAAPTSPAAPTVTVPIEARSGSEVSGRVLLTQTTEGVEILVQVSGATPGEHGVHIHQHGDCSAADASSAGDHFAPDDHPHGLPGLTRQHHLGDLGNLRVSAAGTGELRIVVPSATLRPDDARSLLGRALIVHADPDDGSQPSGQSGSRVGCAVLVRSTAQADGRGVR